VPHPHPLSAKFQDQDTTRLWANNRALQIRDRDGAPQFLTRLKSGAKHVSVSINLGFFKSFLDLGFFFFIIIIIFMCFLCIDPKYIFLCVFYVFLLLIFWQLLCLIILIKTCNKLSHPSIKQLICPDRKGRVCRSH
jgi:hypothetical protein